MKRIMNDARRYIRHEQEYLWGDLHNAQRRAMNGYWSIECESLVWRLKCSINIAGPIEWDKVPWPLVRVGAYELIVGKEWPTARPTSRQIALTSHRMDQYYTPSKDHDRFMKALAKNLETLPLPLSRIGRKRKNVDI